MRAVLALILAAATLPAETGVCSFYARAYNGRLTASGARFDSNALTAAHREYPLGTRLRLTNLANNRSVVVTVNDRGPYVKGREISVTRRVARELGFLARGLTTVNIEKIQ